MLKEPPDANVGVTEELCSPISLTKEVAVGRVRLDSIVKRKDRGAIVAIEYGLSE